MYALTFPVGQGLLDTSKLTEKVEDGAFSIGFLSQVPAILLNFLFKLSRLEILALRRQIQCWKSLYLFTDGSLGW